MLIILLLLLHPIIISFYKNSGKLSNINFSLYHICNKISIIILEDIFLYINTNNQLPLLNHSPIIILISIIITYILRRIVRTYRLYQSVVYLYHPEDKQIYWFGSYYLGFYYNTFEFLIKLFICMSIIEMNYWNSYLYLLLYHIIEMSLYYTKTVDSSNELFHIASNYIFKKLNE
jgi:hypothetical protein